MTEQAAISAASESSVGDDFIKQLRVFGLGTDGNLAKVRPFRISTMQETTIMRAVFMKMSGLDAEQFAENPWGFPFIPYPSANRSTSRTRMLLLPENVSFEFAGHPIFWIDPALTRPTRDESIDPSRWAVRMFYLIMAMGLFEPTEMKWISAPPGKGVILNATDFKNYINDFESPLGKVVYTAQDLAIPYEEVLAQTNVALAQVEQLQERHWRIYRNEQKKAFTEGQALVSAPDAEWDKIAQEVQTVSEMIASIVRKNGSGLAELTDPAYGVAARLVVLLNKYERLCVILASPALRSQSRSSGSYTSVATAMQMYNKSVISGGYETLINDSLSTLFDTTSADLDKFTIFNDTCNRLYLDVSRRLDLSVENFKLIERGEQPYRSYTEMSMGRNLNQSRTTPDDGMMMGDVNYELERILSGEN